MVAAASITATVASSALCSPGGSCWWMGDVGLPSGALVALGLGVRGYAGRLSRLAGEGAGWAGGCRSVAAPGQGFGTVPCSSVPWEGLE